MPKVIYYIIFLTILFSCTSKVEPTILNGSVFGSYFSIQYYGDDDFSKEIEKIFSEIDASLSTYNEQSQISQWNAGNDQLQLSPYFIEIALDAQKVYRESNGYYDPTVKTLVEGWGFGNGKPTATLTQHEVDSLLQFVGYDKLHINAQNATIRKSIPGIQLDFNSIAPGFTADQISEFLLQHNVQNFLVDIGGEIRCQGSNINTGKIWSIGIEDPTKDVNHRDFLKAIGLNNLSLATSGNYRKVKTDNLGNKIVHTINPKTGFPRISNILSATIVTQKCSFADAYATAVMAMGYPNCMEFIQNNTLNSYLVLEENNQLIIKENP